MTIYALLDPKTNNIRYVGQTTQKVNLRYNGHLNEAIRHKKRTKVKNWIKSLLNQNLKPKLIELENADNFNKLCELEKFYISYFNFLTNNSLLNHTEGGEGTPGRILSKNTKKLISKANKGLKRSEECKKKISNSKIGHKHSDEYKIKARSWHKKRPIIDLETLEIYESIMDASRKLNVSSGHIATTLKEKRYTIKNRYLEYLPNNILDLESWSNNLLTDKKLEKKYKDLKKFQQKAIFCVETGEIFESIKQAAKQLNLDSSRISAVCKNKRKSTGNYSFKYFKETCGSSEENK